MKIRIALLSLLLALLLVFSAAAEEIDPVLALVNGEQVRRSDVTAVLSAYENAGYDLSDDATAAYLEDVALTTAIEDVLLRQDMTAKGCFDFDQQTADWMEEQSTLAFQSAVEEVAEMLRGTLEVDEETDLTAYALAYADAIGVSKASYLAIYQEQYAWMNYYTLLTADMPVTDAEVQAAYDARVAESQALYANNAAAFETALATGGEAWYKPDGYRSILQILLPAEGDTAEAKLTSVQTTVDAIESRLSAGEAFETLIAEYGTDTAFDDPTFMQIGYQVHRDSVIWEPDFIDAAFSMEKPGDHSAPFASSVGVHILYYLADTQPGAVALTEDMHDALAYALYQERCQQQLNARIEELSASANVTLY